MFEINDFISKVLPILLACYAVVQVLRYGRREKHLPPGPPTVPILGNAHLLSATDLHKKYSILFWC
jgi:hypothetical protein